MVFRLERFSVPQGLSMCRSSRNKTCSAAAGHASTPTNRAAPSRVAYPCLGILDSWIRDSFQGVRRGRRQDRKSTRLNSSHSQISYAVFCLKKKKNCTSGARIFVDTDDL